MRTFPRAARPSRRRSRPRGSPLALALCALASLAPCRGVDGAAPPHAPDAAPRTADASGTGPPRVGRTRLPDGSSLPALGAGPWRFDFELDLGRDGADLVLVDGTGRPHRFAPRAALADGRFAWSAIDGAGSRIVGVGDRHELHAPDGTVTEFRAGRPSRARGPDGRVARWHEARGRLVGHDDGRGRELRLEYDARGRLARLHGAAGTLELAALGGSDGLDLAPAPGIASGECPADAPCDVSAHPPSAGFSTGPGIPGAIRRDLRPGSCRSHFVERAGLDRGRAIERGLALLPGTGLGAPTVSAFPVADFVGTREITVVRSRDLASATYADAFPDALFDRLLRDGDDIERLLLDPLAERGAVAASAPDRERGVRRIEAGPGRAVVLELVVRHGMASPGHVAQIERAREALGRRGIELRVVEIP